MEAAGDRRLDGRHPWQLREIKLERAVNRYAEGSALITWGNTVVYCTATIEEKVPPFLRGTGRGWVTAEYSMLPRATGERRTREVTKGRTEGRTSEIQRLIGRSLRAAVDMESLGERTLWMDCDVLQADGGTRTAAITGAFVALVDALRGLSSGLGLPALPLRAQVAALSVGSCDGRLLLDLCYEEDRVADVDSNVVMTSCGDFIELQGTAERGSYSRKTLDGMLTLAEAGLKQLFALQAAALTLSHEETKLFGTLAGH